MTRDYHINIFFSAEDGGYIADIPDLQFCSAFGATPEEALAELKVARQAWLEAARKAKKPIPRPQYRPAIYQAVQGTARAGWGGRSNGKASRARKHPS